MLPTLTVKEAILDSAEKRARNGGYGGFSFRDIAADIGIKSASVHYHYPTKADLSEALMKRYHARALAFLGDAQDLDARAALKRMVDLFVRAANDREMCLCGALGVAGATLPLQVREPVTQFAETLTLWLAAIHNHEELPMPPASIVAMLEGALMISVAAGEPQRFLVAIQPLLTYCQEASCSLF